jgi:sarcosine oxidase subunit beta
MVARYSAWRLIREGLLGQKGWKPAWRSPEPKPRYDIVVIGGGGHGLATAYYLAKVHKVQRVAVLERGWIGGGNSGRNTTNIRSNYYFPESARLYDFALKLYEGLSEDLNYNVMFSQRGLVTVTHSRHELEQASRWVGAMQSNGIDVDMISVDEIKRRIPILDTSPNRRFPIWGGFFQKRAGTARHDAVVWGYARAADRLGVDIIQNCEVQEFLKNASGHVIGVQTSRGRIEADKIGVAVAGHSSVMAELAGFRLPLTSYGLQAFVSEPLKPVLDTVLMSLSIEVYVNQSDKGGLVFGGALDHFPSYAQRGNVPTIKEVSAFIAHQMPSLRRVRIARQWAGIVDVAPDSSPILGETPVPGLYINCGWGTGGFKAIPAGGYVLAHHLATGRAHPLAEPFALRRFVTGALIDEAAASGISH